jgi:hypothetical protein
MEQSHVLNLLVHADVGAATPTTAANAYINDLTDLVDGELAVVNDQNMVLSAATVLTDDRVAQTGIRIVGRYGSRIVYSDFIKAENIISVRPIVSANFAEQVTHLGYNGTSGAIQIMNSNTYKIKINFEQVGRTGQGMNDFVSAFFESDSSATGGEVVFEIEQLLRLAFNKQAERPIRMAVLNSAALVPNNEFDQDITVVQGSKFIVSAAGYTTVGGVITAAVGDFIRLGSATETDAAVALGSAVYKVVAINASVMELDRPVTGVSGTYTASADVELIQAATAEIANWGIRFTAIAPTHEVGKRPYSKIAFTLGLEDFGTTTVSYTTAMSLGNGEEEAIADLEWFTYGQSGFRYRADYMMPQYTSRVVSGTDYHQVAIAWASDSRTESIGGPGHNPKQLIIAAADTYANTEAPDIVFEVLEAYTTVDLGALTI